VPRLPRVSGSEIVRALQGLGFEVMRQRGSHIVMRRGPSGCVVPNQLRQAGVSADEFVSALGTENA